MRQKTVLAVIILLALVVAGYKFFQFKARPFEFQSRLLRVRSEEVTGILIQFPGGEELVFSKEAPGWMATDGSRGIRITSAMASELTGSLPRFIARAMLDTASDAHAALGVSPKRGIRVRIMREGGEAENFLLGVIDSAAQLTYLRFKDQSEVYVIPSALTAPFRRPFGYYRDRSFFRLPLLSELDSLHYQNPADSINLRLVPANGGWRCLARREILLDSSAMASLWISLSTFPPPGFADDFDEFDAAGYPERRLIVWRKGGMNPHSLTCYYRKKHDLPYVWISSQHPLDFFSSDSVGVFRSVMVRLDSLGGMRPAFVEPVEKPKGI